MRTMPVVVLAACLVFAAACSTTKAVESTDAEKQPEVATAAWQAETDDAQGGMKPVAASGRNVDDLKRENRALKDELAKMHSDRERAGNGQAGSGEAAVAAPAAAEVETPRMTVDAVRAALREHGVTSLVVSKNPAGEIFTVLPGSLAFGSGQATLTNEAKIALRGRAKAVREDYPEVSIRVEGHTDSDPIKRSKWASNDVLSTARAQAVAVFFVRDCDLPGDRLETRGFGSSRPVASNSTKDGKAQNRRVEIVFVN